MTRYSPRAARGMRALKRFTEAFFLLGIALLVAGQASAWSCASDEPLVPEVSVSDRARISAEVARERALADALRCRSEGRADCMPLAAGSAFTTTVPANGS